MMKQTKIPASAEFNISRLLSKTTTKNRLKLTQTFGGGSNDDIRVPSFTVSNKKKALSYFLPSCTPSHY